MIPSRYEMFSVLRARINPCRMPIFKNVVWGYMGKLELHFYQEKTAELVFTNFSHELIATNLRTARGKGVGAYSAMGCFPWSSAVKAISLFFIRAKSIACVQPHLGKTGEVVMSGISGAVTSLDYALSKEPRWIEEIFGADSQGRLLAKRMILRSNSEMKRPGPVELALNHRLLLPEQIFIFLNEQLVSTKEALEELGINIAAQWVERNLARRHGDRSEKMDLSSQRKLSCCTGGPENLEKCRVTTSGTFHP